MSLFHEIGTTQSLLHILITPFEILLLYGIYDNLLTKLLHCNNFISAITIILLMFVVKYLLYLMTGNTHFKI